PGATRSSTLSGAPTPGRRAGDGRAVRAAPAPRRCQVAGPRPTVKITVSRSLPVHDHLHEVHTVEDVLALVREHGGRVTSSRRLLLEALFEGPGHRTPE